MDIYEVTQETEDGYERYEVCQFRADLSQAACPVEIACCGGWDGTPFQVADGRHDEKQIAGLLMAWMAGDWYSNDRPVRVRDITDESKEVSDA